MSNQCQHAERLNKKERPSLSRVKLAPLDACKNLGIEMLEGDVIRGDHPTWVHHFIWRPISSVPKYPDDCELFGFQRIPVEISECGQCWRPNLNSLATIFVG